MDRIGSAIDESLQAMNVTDRLDRLKQTTSEASEHIVVLIAVFVLVYTLPQTSQCTDTRQTAVYFQSIG